MKNFRKTIIALATVAAMLVPSVAMAATITAEVENAAVEGNVYAGFYKGDVLVKAELGGSAKVETTTTGGDSSTEEAADGATASAKIVTVDDANDIKKITFTVNPDENLTTATAIQMLFSFDNSVVELVDKEGTAVTVAGNGSSEKAPAFFYDGSDYGSEAFGGQILKWYVDGTKTHAWVTQALVEQEPLTVPAYGMDIFGLYFKVKEGKALAADTFSIMTEHNASIIQTVDNESAGICVVSMTDGVKSYTKYASWDGAEDTMAWNGVEIVEDVEPDGKPVVTVTNEVVNPITGVYKLVFAVKGTDASNTAYKATFDFAVDMADVSLWNIAKAEAITSIKKAAPKNAGVYPTLVTCDDCGYDGSWYKEASVAGNVMSITLENAGCPDGCGMDYAQAFDFENKAVFAEIYYIVNDGATVDENTFSFTNAKFDDVAVDFAGFPWKAAETTTTTKTVITVPNVDAPAAADYDSIKVFVWDANQVAQCAPVAGTLND